MGCHHSKPEDVTVLNPAAAAGPEPVAHSEQPKADEPVTEETAPVDAEPEAEEPKDEPERAKELFNFTGHEIDEAGVVFYTVEAVDGSRAFKKRFSDFKKLVGALGSPKNLPALPESGLGSKLRGKHNPEMIKEREEQLNAVLNAIGNDPKLSETDAFKKFVQ